MPVGSFQPQRANNYVPNMVYHSDVEFDGLGIMELTKPLAANNTSIVNAFDITAAGALAPIVSTYLDMVKGTYGRNVRLVLSGAGTPTITVRGKDYLGQPMSEVLTGNGTTPVLGLKAFYFIDSITNTAVAATTMNLGFDLKFGLPFRAIKLLSEAQDGDPVAAGTFVAALATATAPTGTNADTRGTYAMHASHLADGVRSYEFQMIFDLGQLHGARQFFA